MKSFKILSLATALSAATAAADEGFVVLEYRSMQYGSTGVGGIIVFNRAILWQK